MASKRDRETEDSEYQAQTNKKPKSFTETNMEHEKIIHRMRGVLSQRRDRIQGQIAMQGGATGLVLVLGAFTHPDHPDKVFPCTDITTAFLWVLTLAKHISVTSIDPDHLWTLPLPFNMDEALCKVIDKQYMHIALQKKIKQIVSGRDLAMKALSDQDTMPSLESGIIYNKVLKLLGHKEDDKVMRYANGSKESVEFTYHDILRSDIVTWLHGVVVRNKGDIVLYHAPHGNYSVRETAISNRPSVVMHLDYMPYGLNCDTNLLRDVYNARQTKSYSTITGSNVDCKKENQYWEDTLGRYPNWGKSGAYESRMLGAVDCMDIMRTDPVINFLADDVMPENMDQLRRNYNFIKHTGYIVIEPLALCDKHLDNKEPVLSDPDAYDPQHPAHILYNIRNMNKGDLLRKLVADYYLKVDRALSEFESYFNYAMNDGTHHLFKFDFTKEKDDLWNVLKGKKDSERITGEPYFLNKTDVVAGGLLRHRHTSQNGSGKVTMYSGMGEATNFYGGPECLALSCDPFIIAMFLKAYNYPPRMFNCQERWRVKSRAPISTHKHTLKNLMAFHVDTQVMDGRRGEEYLVNF